MKALLHSCAEMSQLHKVCVELQARDAPAAQWGKWDAPQQCGGFPSLGGMAPHRPPTIPRVPDRMCLAVELS
jgi:hypothetical protein